MVSATPLPDFHQANAVKSVIITKNGVAINNHSRPRIEVFPVFLIRSKNGFRLSVNQLTAMAIYCPMSITLFISIDYLLALLIL
ncbi:hypothetical protein D3C80_1805400 [compost metagenome]